MNLSKRIVLHWEDTIVDELKSLNNIQLMKLCANIIAELDRSEISKEIANNIYKFIKNVSLEIRLYFYDLIGEISCDDKKLWPQTLLNLNQDGLVEDFILEYQSMKEANDG